MMIEKIIKYVSEKYGSKPEYLWEKFPNYFVFRNSDTKKWYAAYMKVKKSVLIDGAEGEVSILDVKCRTDFKDLLISSKDGFYSAYHMNKEHWVTILLDGTVDENEIYPIIDESYALVSKKKKN